MLRWFPAVEHSESAIRIHVPFFLKVSTALSRAPCALQWVLISYLFYTESCVRVNINLPTHPTPLPALVFSRLFSASASLFLETQLCRDPAVGVRNAEEA